MWHTSGVNPERPSLGPYVLDEPLGAGGMGAVWSGWNRRWGTQVAVKVLREAHEPSVVASLTGEVRTIASLDHPGIVAVYDQGLVPAGLDGLAAGSPWLAMERAAGTLQRPSTWTEAKQALVGLLDALAAAHAAGVLHLDVKPSNVLRRYDGSIALADFGIALLRADLSGDGRARVSETSWGSPPYMAPERFDGRPERLLPATDLYAVGCVAYELLHHGVPFGARTWQEAADAHRSRPVPPLKPRVPVPPGIADWVGTLLQKRPGDRFQHAADALHALRALGDPITGLGATFVDAAPVVGPTLTATAAGEPVAVEELLSTGPSPAAAPLAPALAPAAPRPARHASGGLLGLLGVPFVGRDDELTRAWSVLAAGGSARITGPWGVGRSRLGQHLMQRAAAAGVHVVAVRPATASDDPDEAPIGKALRDLLGLPGDLSPTARVEAVALRLRRPPDDAAVQTVLAAVDPDDDTAPAEGLRAWARAHDRPTWLWVDDLLTDAALDLLDTWPGPTLSSAADGSLHEHPDRAARWLADHERLPLAPLGEGQVRAVLADWVGLSSAVVTEVAWRAEGDLTLAIRLVTDGVQSGGLVGGSDGWTRADEEEWTLPPDLVNRWAERVATAAPPHAEALRHAAVTAGEVTAERLPVASDTFAQLRDHLVSTGLAAPTPDGFRWPSAALREALTRGFDAAPYHRAVAERRAGAPLTERWVRGQHRLLAGDLPGGADDLLEAATYVIAKGRMVEAAWWLRRVEAAMEGVVPPGDLLRARLAYAYGVLGPTHQGYAKSIAYAQEAVALSEGHAMGADDVSGWRDVRLAALGNLAWLGTVQLLPNVTGPALEAWLAMGGHDEPQLATHYDRLGWHRITIGDPLGSLEAFTTAWKLAGKIGRRTQYVADTSRGVAMAQAGLPEAVDHLTTAGAAMLAAGFASARADLSYALGDAERYRGRTDAALAHYDEALRASAEGDARADIGFLVGRALCLAAMDRVDEAVAALRGCVAQLDDEGDTWEAVIHLHLLAWGPLPGTAAAEVDRWLQVITQTGFVDPDLAMSLRRLVARLGDDAVPGLREVAEHQATPYPWLP